MPEKQERERFKERWRKKSFAPEMPRIPSENSLREGALAHLARFASTKKNLRLVLERRVKRWALRAEKAGMLGEEVQSIEASLMPLIDKIITSMEGLGAVDDVAFTRSRVRRLQRSGQSRRAMMAHLQAKGVEGEIAQKMIGENFENFDEEHGIDAELGAAVMLARKRALGPFQRPDREAKEKIKILALFARNGFTQEIAEQVLGMDRAEAEDIFLAFRQ